MLSGLSSRCISRSSSSGGERDVRARPGATSRRVRSSHWTASSRPPHGHAERVLVAVDCAKERLGADPSLLEESPFTLDIDHHHDNTRFGDVNLIVPDASSTGEILSDVFRELGVEITPEIADRSMSPSSPTPAASSTRTRARRRARLAADLVDGGRLAQGLPDGVRERAVREAEVARAGARSRRCTRAGDSSFPIS